MSNPARHPRPRPPRFLGQGLLIVLPVAVLTVVGLLSLRQDRLLAEQEAREGAVRLAQEAANRALAPLFTRDPFQDAGTRVAPGVDLFRPVFEVSEQAELIWPPPVEAVPGPCPLDPVQLPAPAREAWEAAQRAAVEGGAAAASDAWAAFLATDPPDDFAAHGLFELAQAEARQGALNQAEVRFRQVATDHPSARGESGLLLAPLALWRAAEIRLRAATDPAEQQRRLLDACSNLVFRPSALTAALLERAAETVGLEAASPTGSVEVTALTTFRGAKSVLAWWQLWDTTELSRALFTSVRQEWEQRSLIVTNESGATELLKLRAAMCPLWVTAPFPSPSVAPALRPDCGSGDWLFVRFPPSGLRFVGWSECEVSDVLRTVRGEIAGLPPYFEVSFTIAGRTLPGPWGGPVLAERAADGSAQPGRAEPTLKAAVHLADPAALYARQRQRTWWFVALVLAAAATAGVGLLSAYRAFQRQLRLNQMKSNFVSSVSHELRAPIASVRLLAESLDRGTVTDEAKRREYFRLMGQECRRLSALIENVLDFSRMDQGRKQYEFEPTDLPALVAQTVRLMEPYAAERQVALKLLLPSSFCLQPSLDARAMQQALVNLIDNAVKHSPPGAAVEISLESPEEPAADSPGAPQSGTSNRPSPIANGIGHRRSPRVSPMAIGQSPIGNRQPAIADPTSAIGYRRSAIRLAVADRGPGIPADEHARIFEPFYRRGSELRRETPGIGIGLSIVKHVVEAHGGCVSVHSQPGQGSRFVITLPAHATDREAPSSKHQAPEKLQTPNTSPRRPPRSWPPSTSEHR